MTNKVHYIPGSSPGSVTYIIGVSNMGDDYACSSDFEVGVKEQKFYE